MKNFGSIEEFYRNRKKQRQSGLFTDHVFSGKKDMQYLVEQERVTPNTISDEAIIAIKNLIHLILKIRHFMLDIMN